MPGRKIRPNPRSITGRIPSDKKAGMIAHESLLERDVILLLEFDKRVRAIAEQPWPPIRFKQERRWHTYTPDFFVTFWPTENLRPTYLEAKYTADLRDQWTYLHPRLRAGFRHARSEGADFHIVTEKDIPRVKIRNLRRLWPHRSTVIEASLISDIVGSLKQYSLLTAEQLLAGLAATNECRAAYLTALWHCLASGSVRFDLESDLQPKSLLWLPPLEEQN